MADNTNGNAEGGAANGVVDSKGEFNECDLKELQQIKTLIISRKNELGKERDTVEQMSSFGHWWDAKVPESDKSLINFVSLNSCTNKMNMKKQIEEYKKFYAELQSAVDDLRDAAKDNDVDADEILKLYDSLCNMIQKAESSKEATDSSTLYEIHKEFLSRQKSLENMIKGVECIALKKKLKKVTQGWEKSLGQIDHLKSEIHELRTDNQKMQNKVDNLVTHNEEMQNKMDNLVTDNKELMENQKLHLQHIENITNLLRELLNKQ